MDAGSYQGFAIRGFGVQGLGVWDCVLFGNDRESFSSQNRTTFS